MTSRLLPPDGAGNRAFEPPVPVLVERDGAWHRGQAEVWRDSRYLVRYRNAATTQTYLHWVPAERVRADDEA